MDIHRSLFPDKTKPISKPPKPNTQTSEKYNCQASMPYQMCKCPVCEQIYTSTIRAPLVLCSNFHKICLFCFNTINKQSKIWPQKEYAKCYKCNQKIIKLRLNKDVLQLIKSNIKLQVINPVDSNIQNIEDYIKQDLLYKFQQGYMLSVQSAQSYEYVINQKNQLKWKNTQKKQVKNDLFVCQIKSVVSKHPLPLGIFVINARFQKIKLLNKNAQIGICTAKAFNESQQTLTRALGLNTITPYSNFVQLAQVRQVAKSKTDFVKFKIQVNMFKEEISWMLMDDKNEMLGYEQQKLRLSCRFLQQYIENIYFLMRYENNEPANELLNDIGLKIQKIKE